MNAQHTGSPRRGAPVSPPRVGRCLAAAALCVLLAACGQLPRNATPADAALDGRVPGFPHVRAWAGLSDSPLEADLIASFRQESEQDFPRAADGTVRYPQLAL